MNITELCLGEGDLRRLLGAANADAALLYLFLRCGNDPDQAVQQLEMNQSRVATALALLRQLGLWQEERQPMEVGQRPNYTEQDVAKTMESDAAFRALYSDVQQRLGRVLNTEELKILLGMVRYLGLGEDVICVLVSFCQEQARQKGRRAPSLRSIEKEAYSWAEQGIDTMEEAAAYIQKRNVQRSRLARLMELLQIRGRSLTAAEERYAGAWLQMGLEEALFSMAYERTCLNTGGMNWPYMNKILTRWHESGFRTAEDVRLGDHKTGASKPQRQLDADEQAAIQRMLQEG